MGMTDLSVWLVGVLLILLGAAYVGYFGVIARPAWSVYAYLLMWVTVPKALRLEHLTGSQDLPEGITLFRVLETIAVVAMVVALAVRQGHQPAWARPLRRVALLLLASGICSLAVLHGALSPFLPAEVDGLWRAVRMDSLPQERIFPVVGMLHAVVVVYACGAFIRTRSEMGRVLLILLFSGVELLGEAVAFVLLGLVPGVLQWTMHSSGRFMSLVYTSYDLAGEFLIIAVGICLYFARSRRRLELYVLAVLVGLPVLATFQRSVLAGTLITATVFVWFSAPQSKTRVTYVSIAGVLVVLGLMFRLDQPLMNAVASKLGREVRPEYWSMDTLEVRFGFWARGVDLARFILPMGVGSGMAGYAMQYPVPQRFEGLSDTAWLAYESFVRGERTTSVHNTFLEFVIENGVMGALALGAFLWLVFASFRRWRASSCRGQPAAEPPWLLQAAVYSILLGLGVNACFEPSRVPYSVMLLLIYFAMLAKVHQDAAVQRGTVRPNARVVVSPWQPAREAWPSVASRGQALGLRHHPQ